jgi:hypothetical protein
MDMSGGGGHVVNARFEGSKYVIDLNLSRVQMANPFTMKETNAQGGQVG